MKKTKTITLDFNFEVLPKLKNKTFRVKYNVKSMMGNILLAMSNPETMKREGAKYWAEEYVKCWIMNEAGIVLYPLEEEIK